MVKRLVWKPEPVLNGFRKLLNRFKTIGLNHGLNRWVVVWAKPLGALSRHFYELQSRCAPLKDSLYKIGRIKSVLRAYTDFPCVVPQIHNLTPICPILTTKHPICKCFQSQRRMRNQSTLWYSLQRQPINMSFSKPRPRAPPPSRPLPLPMNTRSSMGRSNPFDYAVCVRCISQIHKPIKGSCPRP